MSSSRGNTCAPQNQPRQFIWVNYTPYHFRYFYSGNDEDIPPHEILFVEHTIEETISFDTGLLRSPLAYYDELTVLGDRGNIARSPALPLVPGSNPTRAIAGARVYQYSGAHGSTGISQGNRPGDTNGNPGSPTDSSSSEPSSSSSEPSISGSSGYTTAFADTVEELCQTVTSLTERVEYLEGRNKKLTSDHVFLGKHIDEQFQSLQTYLPTVIEYIDESVKQAKDDQKRLRDWLQERMPGLFDMHNDVLRQITELGDQHDQLDEVSKEFRAEMWYRLQQVERGRCNCAGGVPAAPGGAGREFVDNSNAGSAFDISNPFDGGDPDDSEGSDGSDFEGREEDVAPPRCPDWCGCRGDDPADEHVIGAWSRRTSNSSAVADDHILARHNISVRETDDTQIDPEVEERALYMHDQILRLHEPVPTLTERQMHYRPLSTADVLRVDPPNPVLLVDLFSQVFLVDEPFAKEMYDAFNPEHGVDELTVTIREGCTHIFNIVLEARTILYTLMTTSEPSTYLHTQLARLQTLSEGFENSQAMLTNPVEEVNCWRIRAVMSLMTHAINSIRDNLMLSPERFPHIQPRWTWQDVLAKLRAYVKSMQEDHVDTGFPYLSFHHQHGRQYEREAQRYADAIAVFEFCRFIVRQIDLFFSLLRMEGWAFRRYEEVLDGQNEPDGRYDFVRLVRLPTLYDSVVEIEYAGYGGERSPHQY